jgi:outer membrane protein assembly factor BamB
VAAAALAGMGAVRAFADADSPRARVLWAARATLVSGYEFGPVTSGGLFLLDRTVVTRSGGPRLDLCCLDPATGRHRWRRPLTAFARYRGEVTAGPGGVWVRSTDELHELDADTGTVRWSQQRRFPGLIPATAHGNGVLYDVGAVAGSNDAGTVHALEPRTGRQVWKRDLEGRPVGPLVVARGVLYVISASARERRERVHALDAATGAVRWVTGFPDDTVVRRLPYTPSYTDATLSVADDTVYVSVEGRYVHALDARTGATRWSVRPQVDTNVLGEADASAAFPVAAGNMLFLGTGDGVLRAFDRRDGRQRWAVDTGAPPAPVGDFRRRFTPLVADGTVFVRGGDGVRALRADNGRLRWQRATDPSAGEPVLAGGRLHIPGTWEVTSHDALSGRTVQRLDLRDHGRSPTALLAGKDALYVLAGLDAVLAVGLPG